MKYQTPEQFKEIYDLTQVAQYSRAAEKCVEYGFYLNDLKKAYDNSGLGVANAAAIVRMIEDAWNLGVTAELAQTMRKWNKAEDEGLEVKQ